MGWTVNVFLLPFLDRGPLHQVAVSRKDQPYIGPYRNPTVLWPSFRLTD